MKMASRLLAEEWESVGTNLEICIYLFFLSVNQVSVKKKRGSHVGTRCMWGSLLRGRASPLLSLPSLGPSHLTRGPPSFTWYTRLLLFSFCLWNNHFVCDSFSDPEPSSHRSTTAKPQIRNKEKCTNGQNHTKHTDNSRRALPTVHLTSVFWLLLSPADKNCCTPICLSQHGRR